MTSVGVFQVRIYRLLTAMDRLGFLPKNKSTDTLCKYTVLIHSAVPT